MTIEFPHRLINGIPPDFTWVQDNLDFLRALMSRNAITNGGLEAWTTTTFTNPADATAIATGWVLNKGGTSAPSANIAREASILDSGLYSLKATITGAGSSNSYLDLGFSIASPESYRGKTVIAGAMVKCDSAGKLQMGLWDGAEDWLGDFHPGDGSWQKLIVVRQIPDDTTEIIPYVHATPDFTGSYYVDSAFLYEITPYASDAMKAALGFDPLLIQG